MRESWWAVHLYQDSRIPPERLQAKLTLKFNDKLIWFYS